jgi:CubicO group peptidase (beta-lactamase class C family)
MSTLTPQNTVTWFGRNTAQHKAEVDKWAALGFRTTSLTIYGDPGDPTYGAVMVKRSPLVAEHQVFPRSQPQLQADFDAMAKKGMGPYILTATGPGNAPTFAAAFRPMNPIPFTRLNLTHDQFESDNAARHALGETLLWVDSFGDPSDLRFTAVWAPNPGRVAWSTESWNNAANKQDCADGPPTLQQRFEALRASGARPAHLAVLPSGNICELYNDSTLGPWVSRVGLSPSDFQTEYNKQTGAGLQPIQFSAKGSASGAQFAAIFASRDDTDPLAPRSQGPVTVAAIDSIVQDFMNQENLRGAALAITNGAQLVYAKGYTNAPAGYPDVTPQTLFRQASISKVFTGVAMWRLLKSNTKLKDGSTLTLDTKVQSIMKLTQPDGSAPSDARWAQITIRHLLESDSGINQGLSYGSRDAAAAFNKPLPATPAQLLSHATSLMLTGNPGDPKNSVYGNFDYLLLSNIIATIHGNGVGHYEQALRDLVLTPLGQSHTRSSVSLVGSQQAGEAHYHMRVYDPANGWPLYPLEVLPTVRTADGQIVASQYGNVDYEMFAGAGGLSSSVVDVARLGAMFSDRVANPVLSADSIDSLMQAVINAGNTLTTPAGKGSHGYYGLDWAQANDPANHVYTAAKGGWLPAQGTVLQFTTSSLGFALAINGNADVKYDWLTPISQIAANQSWAPGDLFVTAYNMSALGEVKKPHKIIVHPPLHSLAKTQSQVKLSISTSFAEHRARKPVK